jgi:ElaB/YqjD/DUF883 family membrane-anchored ribosome-binding protein
MAQEYETAKERRADDVDRSPEAIHAEMIATRSALADKVEALEDRVSNKVRAVQAKVDHVRDSIKDAGEKVKRSFDLPYQVRQHPWPMVGASVLVGVVLGSIGRDSSESRHSLDERSDFGRGRFVDDDEPEIRRSRPGFFSEELRGLREAAIGAMMSLVRTGLRNTFPGVAPQTDRIVDGMTRKLGGQPVQGDLFTDRAD